MTAYADGRYHVKFVLGGTRKGVPQESVSLPTALENQERKSRQQRQPHQHTGEASLPVNATFQPRATAPLLPPSPSRAAAAAAAAAAPARRELSSQATERTEAVADQAAQGPDPRDGVQHEPDIAVSTPNLSPELMDLFQSALVNIMREMGSDGAIERDELRATLRNKNFAHVDQMDSCLSALDSRGTILLTRTHVYV